jgi:hypothetical protein
VEEEAAESTMMTSQKKRGKKTSQSTHSLPEPSEQKGGSKKTMVVLDLGTTTEKPLKTTQGSGRGGGG